MLGKTLKRWGAPNKHRCAYIAAAEMKTSLRIVAAGAHGWRNGPSKWKSLFGGE